MLCAKSRVLLGAIRFMGCNDVDGVVVDTTVHAEVDRANVASALASSNVEDVRENIVDLIVESITSVM